MSANAPTPIEGGPSTSLKGWNNLAYRIASDVPTAHKRAAAIRRSANHRLANIARRK